MNGNLEVKTAQPVSNGTANKVEAKAGEVKDIAQSTNLINVQEVKPEAEAPKVEQPKVEPTKMEIKEQLKEEKPALNFPKLRERFLFLPNPKYALCILQGAFIHS